MKHRLLPLFLFIACGISVLWPTHSQAQINIPRYLYNARVHLSKDQPRQAVRYLNPIIQRNPDHYQAYFFRGVAKFQLHDYVGAQQDFTHTLRIHPFYSHAYHNRGIAYARQNNFYRALQDYNQALQYEPENADIYFNKGLTLLALEHYSTAILAFSATLQRHATNARAHLYRGKAWESLGVADSALSDYHQSIRLNPLSAKAFTLRGEFYLRKDSVSKALHDFERALKLDSQDPHPYFNRARAYMQLANDSAALADYNRVLELAPKSAVAYFNRALVLARQGKKEQAIADYTQVLTLQKGHPLSHFNRGIMYLQQDQPRQAITDFSAALRLIPDFTEALMNRSHARRQLGDIAGAHNDWQQAMQLEQARQQQARRFSDSTAIKQLIQLDANFYDPLGYTRSEALHLLSQNTQLQLKGIYYLATARKALAAEAPLFSLITEQLNAAQPSNQQVRLRLQNNLRENLDAAMAASRDSARQVPQPTALTRSINALHVLDFNSASEQAQVFNQQAQQSAAALWWQASVSTLTTDFIQSMERQAPIKSEIHMGSTESTAPRQEVVYDYSQAIAWLDASLQARPEMALAWYNRGTLHARMQNYRQALHDFGQAIDQQPGLAAAYFNRAIIHFRLNQKTQGCSDFSKAGELGMPEAYEALKALCSGE